MFWKEDCQFRQRNRKLDLRYYSVYESSLFMTILLSSSCSCWLFPCLIPSPSAALQETLGGELLATVLAEHLVRLRLQLLPALGLRDRLLICNLASFVSHKGLTFLGWNEIFCIIYSGSIFRLCRNKIDNLSMNLGKRLHTAAVFSESRNRLTINKGVFVLVVSRRYVFLILI